jgi:hypothetical protein
VPPDDRYPTPFLNMSPAGLPGVFLALFVALGFATLFVSENTARVLLWLMVGVILLISGVVAYRWLAARHR